MDLNVLLSSGGAGVIIAYALQGLKKAPWFPWLNAQTPKLNLAVSVIAAAVSQAGIHYTWHGAEDGTLIITGLTLANLRAFISHTAGQWAVQHVSYKSLVVPSELLAAVVNELKTLQGGPNALPPKPAA